MLPRNLEPGLGLCNGTRLGLIHMTNRVLHVKIITGPCAEQQAFIPWITQISSDELPFELHCCNDHQQISGAVTWNSWSRLA
jgi:DNA helicase Pif1, 2B domain